MGPILEEFKSKKEELISSLHALYTASNTSKNRERFDLPHPISISVQGGIGTAEEAQLLSAQNGIESTGWGTPFLL